MKEPVTAVRIKRAACCFIAALVIALAVPAPAYADGEVTAQSAVIMEVTTHRVLAYTAAHERLPMASATKVMTAIIAIERCQLDESVTVANEAVGTEGSSIYLERGEKLSMEDMLYGLMLRSGNDAAVAIAIHVAGSVEGFASLMNKKAQELGALNTHFANPNGLHDEEHFTTAYDFALICAYAFQNETFVKIASSKYHKTTTGNYVRTMKNKNKLLWDYEGCIGGKTAYTKAAGKCLVFAAERDGMRVVGVVLNSADTYGDAKRLMDGAFEGYRMKKILSAGDTAAKRIVAGSGNSLLELVAAEDIIIPVKRTGEELAVKVKLLGEMQAPIAGGEQLGELTVASGDEEIANYPVVAKSAVDRQDYLSVLDRLFMRWTG